MSTLDDLIVELEQSRTEFHALVDDIDQQGSWKQRSPEQGWNNGQLLTHIANGVNRIPATALRLKDGKGFNPPKPLFRLANALNLWDTRFRSRNATPQSLKDLYDQGHQIALQTARDMNDDDWERSAMVMGEERSVRDYFGFVSSHLREHADSMRR